jgi:hypothetical protein
MQLSDVGQRLNLHRNYAEDVQPIAMCQF